MYQEGGRDSSSSQTAGGAKGLGVEGAAEPSRTAAISNISLSQQPSAVIGLKGKITEPAEVATLFSLLFFLHCGVLILLYISVAGAGSSSATQFKSCRDNPSKSVPFLSPDDTTPAISSNKDKCKTDETVKSYSVPLYYFYRTIPQYN